MSKAMERAKELRSGSCGNYNCAQSVLIPKWEEMGLDDDMAKRLSKNFGVGMKIGSTCGAITGGLMVQGRQRCHRVRVPAHPEGTSRRQPELPRPAAQESGSGQDE